MFGAKLIIGLHAADFVLFSYDRAHIVHRFMPIMQRYIYGKTLMHDLDFV